MENSNNLYKKALKYYYGGKINKAISICSKCLSINPKNSAALSLKGLLLYFQGNLKEARNIWEKNYKINGDEVAKKYLIDSRSDFEKMDIYDEAVTKMRSMDINLAIKLFEHCKKSDFNCLNVNQKLMQCYMKKGEFDKLMELIEEHKIIDKDNKYIKEIEKELIKVGVKEKEVSKELFIKVGLVAGAAVITLMLCKYAINIVTSNVGDKTSKPSVVKKDKEDETKKDTASESEGNKDEAVEDKKDTTSIGDFPADKLKELIEDKNVEEIAKILKNYDKEELKMNDKILFKKANDFVQEQGVLYYLERGNKLLEESDYEKALIEYNKGVEYLKYGNGYDEALLAKLVVINMEYDNKDDVIKNIDLMIKHYPDGGYTPDSVYQVMQYMEDIDLPQAKKYAETILEKYPDSMYVNDVTKSIIDK